MPGGRAAIVFQARWPRGLAGLIVRLAAAACGLARGLGWNAAGAVGRAAADGHATRSRRLATEMRAGAPGPCAAVVMVMVAAIGDVLHEGGVAGLEGDGRERRRLGPITSDRAHRRQRDGHT